ncbi:MAG: hypothetical protein PHN31_00155 [Candidatus Gracilibacteria bacterium]|nr:hypothetical protein [Candidatus Gracilibacteria bacterium]
MIEISSKKIELKKKNEILLKTIELDSDLSCFILIDSEDKKFSEIILNKIIDNIIGKISKQSAYKDFSLALENTNIILKSWRQEEGLIGKLSIIVAVLNDKNLIFSTIGLPSGYLIKRDKEIIEITEKDDNKKEFSFISNGELKGEEIVILCSDRLLHHISKSDIIDSIDVDKIDDVSNNLEITLLEEKLNKNLGFIVIKEAYFKDVKKESFICFKNYCFKAFDNNLIKKTIALYMLAKEKFSIQKKSIRAIILFLGILVSFFILYSTISGIIIKTSKTEVINDYKKDLQNSKDLIKLASDNISNQEVFDENIKKAEAILETLKENKLFLTDIEAIDQNIIILKKQFNLVETFEERTDNMVYNSLPKTVLKVLDVKGALYAMTPKSIVGPIISGETSKEYIFNELGDDSFVDIIAIDGDIFLVTKMGKIVAAEKNGFFRYYDVKGQTKWEDFKYATTYNTYLYTLSSAGNQVYKHKKFGTSFEKGISYLTDEDSKTFNNIIDIGIDGGIYLLKGDLSMVKLFNSPSYRLEALVLNKLPKNYDIEKGTSSPRILVGSKLKYVYLFLNNKVWIFKTNSPNFNQTKTLTYLGQIDGVNKILDFTVYRDGEVFVLNKNGIFRINFEVSDNKLILK